MVGATVFFGAYCYCAAVPDVVPSDRSPAATSTKIASATGAATLRLEVMSFI